MSYTVQISETQRKFIVNAMTEAKDHPEFHLSDEPQTGEAFETEKEEFQILLDMLNELPEKEDETPGVLHGLSL